MFQETMENILQGLNIVMCYINDILMTGKTDEERLMNLVKFLPIYRNMDCDYNSLSMPLWVAV